jgi:hypothetical protein
VERTFLGTETFRAVLRWQRPTQMKNHKQHGARCSTQECEWKQGESEGVNIEASGRLPRWSAMKIFGRTAN